MRKTKREMFLKFYNNLRAKPLYFIILFSILAQITWSNSQKSSLYIKPYVTVRKPWFIHGKESFIDLNHISRRPAEYSRSLKETVACKCGPHGVCLVGSRSHDKKQSISSFAWRPWGSGFYAYSRFFLTHKHNLISAKNECMKNLIKLLYPLFPLFMVDWPWNPIWDQPTLQ